MFNIQPKYKHVRQAFGNLFFQSFGIAGIESFAQQGRRTESVLFRFDDANPAESDHTSEIGRELRRTHLVGGNDTERRLVMVSYGIDLVARFGTVEI